MSSELTDSGQSALNSSVNPDDGDPSDTQISGDVLQDNIIALRYSRSGATLNFNLWGELRDQMATQALVQALMPPLLMVM